MRPNTLAAFALVLAALGACSETTSVTSVPDAAFAPAPWESHYAEGELLRSVVGRLVQPVGSGNDSEREPCAGGRVELWSVTPDGFRLDKMVAEGVSDAAGRFELGSAPVDRWAVLASKEGRASSAGGYRVHLDGALDFGANEEVVLGMRWGRDVHGVLVDDLGTAIAGETVIAASMSYRATTRTDDQGGFDLVIPPGPSSLSWEGQLPGTVLLQLDLPEAAPIEDLRVVRPRRWKTSGRVLDRAEGNPVPGATVLVDGLPHTAVRTDAEGRFEIAAGGGIRIAAFGSGGGLRSMPAPDAGEFELRLRPAFDLSGRVVGPAGAAVEGARLMAIAPSIGGGVDRIVGPLTDADGRFHFDWLPRPARTGAGAAYVVAWRRGVGVSEALEITQDGTIELTMHGAASVRGQLSDSDGQPWTRAVSVRSVWQIPGAPERIAERFDLAATTAGWVSGDGSFRLDGIPHGFGAKVEIDMDGWVNSIAVEPAATAAAPQEVQLEAPRGKSIRGRVVRRSGDPLAEGGRISVTRLGQNQFEVRRSARFEQDGAFEIPDLPDGRYQLLAVVPGFEPGGSTAVAGDVDAVVVMERKSRVVVRIAFPEDLPEAQRPDSVEIALTDRKQRRTESMSGPPWQVEFDRVWAGKYGLDALAGALRGGLDEVDIPDGERVVFEIQLERTLVLAGVLLDADDQPVAGVQIIAAPRGIPGCRPEVVKSGPDGAFSIAGLAPGRWVLRATPKRRAPLQLPFDVGPEGVEEIRAALPAHGAVSVRAGQALGGAVVSLDDGTGEAVAAWGPEELNLRSRFRADESGAVVVTGVRAGVVRVRVSHASLPQPIQRTVTVGAGATVEVVVP
jgi:hypothetical protein